MSTVTKPSTLRAIVPKTLAQKTVAALGPFGKADTHEILLNTGGLTTDNVVRCIKDCTKLRDEIQQAIRQLGIEREPAPAPPEPSKLRTDYSEIESQATVARGDHQRLLTEQERVDRQLQEVERQLSSVDQLKATGFNYDEIAPEATGYRRILGKLPLKKLEPAQKALRALLKERTVLTTGARRTDGVYLLVATPTEEASQTLQTLLLYDFVPTDMPTFEGPDLDEALGSWRAEKDALKRERESLESKLEDLRRILSVPLNKSIDQIEETLLFLRGSLRLGEGATAAHIFAQLDKPPSPVALGALKREGVMELD